MDEWELAETASEHRAESYRREPMKEFRQFSIPNGDCTENTFLPGNMELPGGCQAATNVESYFSIFKPEFTSSRVTIFYSCCGEFLDESSETSNENIPKQHTDL